jgi:hypothetical protein
MTIKPPTDTHRQATRDMPRAQYWQSQARRLLLAHLEENTDFQARAEDIKVRFPQFSYQSFLRIIQYGSGCPLVSWDKAGILDIREGLEDDDAVRYCKEITDLAQTFGLRCQWGAGVVHKLVSEPGTYPGNAWNPQEEIVDITLQVRISPGTKWGDVKGAVLKEAKRQFDDAVKPLRERAEFPERDRGPDNLERNVEILYHRICLGLTPLEIFNEGDKNQGPGVGLTYEAIRDIVSDTARLLEITL